MFCPLSGYMLELDPVRGMAHCPMTGYSKSLQGEHSAAAGWLGRVRATGAMVIRQLVLPV